jgi:type VI protein secretion system component VasK
MGLLESWRREREQARRWRENVRLYGSRRIYAAMFAQEVAMLGIVACSLLTVAAGITIEIDGAKHVIGISQWVFVTGIFAFVLAMACGHCWWQAELAAMNLRLDLETVRDELEEATAQDDGLAA